MQFYPWIGGVNTALDPAVIPQNQLTRGEHVLFGTRGSRKKRDGIDYDWDDVTTGLVSICGLHEFSYGSTARTRKFVGVTDAETVHSYSTGNASSSTRAADLFAGTAWGSAVTQAVLASFTNLCVIAVDGASNVVKKWTGTGNIADLGVNTTTGDTHSSTTIDNLASTANIVIGAAISGTGIPANTTVTGFTGVSSISISNAATATSATVTLTFTVTPPVASIVVPHNGRLWTNDKTNLDRVHFSETGNGEIWGGLGDSGAFDIGTGDGDPDGITAIFPSFHGILYVAKRTKLYKIIGDAPENYQVILVSDGIGCVGPLAVCSVDQDELYFVSDRGVHSVSQTEQLGDFPVAFVSADIQTTVNDNWIRRKYIVAKYLPNLNSLVFAVTDASVGSSFNNTLWFYNLPLKSWYSWLGIPCQSLIVANDADKKRMYIGGNVSRLARAQTGVNYDVSTAGVNTAISYTVKTGLLFPDNQPYLLNSFRRFILYYRPRGSHTITVSVKVDNAASQSISFSQVDSVDLLGSTFVLGTSRLGYNFVMAPYAKTIDGHGHGIEVTITQSGIEEEAEIQGFAIEYEPAGTSQETITS